jgi:hypothetical protein
MMTYYFMGQSFHEDEVEEIRECFQSLKTRFLDCLEYVTLGFVANKKNID